MLTIRITDEPLVRELVSKVRTGGDDPRTVVRNGIRRIFSDYCIHLSSEHLRDIEVVFEGNDVEEPEATRFKELFLIVCSEFGVRRIEGSARIKENGRVRVDEWYRGRPGEIYCLSMFSRTFEDGEVIGCALYLGGQLLVSRTLRNGTYETFRSEARNDLANRILERI